MKNLNSWSKHIQYKSYLDIIVSALKNNLDIASKYFVFIFIL